MVHEGAKRLPIDRPDFRSEVLDGVEVGKVEAAVVGLLAVSAKLLHVHGIQAHLHSLDALEQENHLGWEGETER